MSKSSMEQDHEFHKMGIRVVKISIASLLITATIELIMTFISGSAGILADAFHNFSDVMTSIPVWFAFHMGLRKPNARFTWGYHRLEDLVTFFIITVIMATGVYTLIMSLDHLQSQYEVTHIPLAISAGAVGVVGNLIVAIYRIKAGRKMKSLTLEADGRHALLDSITSLAAIVGLIGVALGFPKADPIAGIVISAIIFFIGIITIKDFAYKLMDQSDPEEIDHISRIVDRYPQVSDVMNIRLSWSGHHRNIQMDIELPSDMSLDEAHEIGEKIREDVCNEFDMVDVCIIHFEPQD